VADDLENHHSQLKPTIMTLFLLQVGRIFYSDFGLFYQVPLNAGALYDVTTPLIPMYTGR
jgi:ABC-type polysaccharide transport system permease subunit